MSEILIDAIDCCFLKNGFRINKFNKYAYVVIQVDKKPKLLHRLIMGEPELMVVDHINGNTLDNRRHNLRICTQAQNLANRKKNSNWKYSKYKGVGWHRQNSSFTASCKRKKIGYFKNEIEAALAYDKCAKEFYGEFAKLNFPN